MLGAALGLVVVGATCSLENREGPDVTCADLLCGKINACHDSIIAQCLDGVTVKYHVCMQDKGDLCEASWQVKGQYKCDQFTTDCEGCRPEREGCPGEDGGSE
jgi:hypothetical protein